MSKSWIPKLPPKWQKTKLRHVARIYAGGTPDRQDLEMWQPGKVPWLNSGAVNQNVVTSPSELISCKAADSGATRWVPKNSVIVALAGQGRTKGMAARTAINTTVNQSLAAVVPGTALEYRYLHYWLQTNYLNVRALGGGDLRDGLNLKHIGSISIPLATMTEQRSIADFLDCETTEIDAFIKDSWELIRYTKEHQAAELDSIVGEKGSPSVKLKYLAELTTGFPFKSDSFKPADQGFTPLLRGINVAPGRLDWSETVAIDPDEANKYASYVLEEGDLVLGMDRPFIGEGLRIAPVTLKDRGALLVQRVARLRADARITSSEWLYKVLRGSLFKAHLEPTFTGVSVPHISPRLIGDFPIPLPALTEQESRLKILLKREMATRTILTDTERAIELAKERRAALISAAVTGQIDVTQKRRPVAEVLEDEVGVRV